MRDQAETWNARVAGVYDDWVPDCDEGQIDALAALAQGGPALELGIGTGRVALPLAARGVPVHGIDSSPAMIERLRRKRGGKRIPVTLGNLADVAVDGPFSLVFAVYGAVNQLVTQDEQVRCFVNVAKRLTDGGAFVVETGGRLPGQASAGGDVRPGLMEPGRVSLNVSRHDPLSQVVELNHVVLTPAGVELFPSRYRYIWPAEMDLMARLAGLRLRYRLAGWDGAAYTGAEETFISVYDRARRRRGR